MASDSTSSPSRREVLFAAGAAAVAAAAALTGTACSPETSPPSAPAPNPTSVPATAAPTAAATAAPTAPPPLPYPPARTGWRGSHPGAFENMHRLSLGKETFPLATTPVEEKYDLVVVGGGASGLTAAYMYRKRFPKAQVLILDNHDDFGGHARRNEFHLPDGTKLLSYAGSESLQSPKAMFSKDVKALMAELGVDVEGLRQRFNHTFYPKLGLGRGVFFDREHFGTDKTVTGDFYRQVADDISPEDTHERSVPAFLADLPLPQADRDALLSLYTQPIDYLQRKSPEKFHDLKSLRGGKLKAEREARDALCAKLSYETFLRDYVGLSPLAIAVFQQRTDDFLAIGLDGLATDFARTMDLPGTDHLGLSEPSAEEKAEREEPYRYHFPDGNASIVRLLVARLIPNVVAAPLKGMDDVVLADFDYTKLDRLNNDVRLRLSSTVCRIENPSGPVSVGYLDLAGKLHRVEGKHVVLACYNMAIPYLFSEADLPAAQRAALSRNVKAPLVYGRAVVRNWQPWMKAGVHEFYCPGLPYARVKLDYAVSMGGYQHAAGPDAPTVIHMVRVPLPPHAHGQDARAQARAGRVELLTETHEQREKALRDQLQRMLGPHGFDEAKDILAVTINVWSHGYSYCLNTLYDEDGEDEKTSKVATAPIGKVVIANSDATWTPYLHAAMDNGITAAARFGRG